MKTPVRQIQSALPIFVLLALSAAVVLGARPPQNCYSPEQEQTLVSDDCGSVTYDLSASDSVYNYDAGDYTSLGACLAYTTDCDCNPGPTEEDGTFQFHSNGSPEEGWNVWWDAIYRQQVFYFRCTTGACMDVGMIPFVPSEPGPYYQGYGTLPPC